MTFQRHQSGAAVLIFLTIVLLGVTSLLVTELSVNKLNDARTQSTSKDLNLAKQALIGFAQANAIPGSLPCPDTTGDGLENSAAGGCQSQLGLLPSRTLNLPVMTDQSGSLLWYAVDLSYTANSAATKNSSINTTLTLDGLSRAAVIIAPNGAIESQFRRLLNRADYLEGINADANLNVFDSTVSSIQNDRFLSIEPGAFWNSIEQRVVSDIAILLNDYRAQCGEYPWAANFGGPFTSVTNQQFGALPLVTALPDNWGSVCGTGVAPTPVAWMANWSGELLYQMCQTAQGTCTTIINSPNTPGSGAIIAPGIALAGQARPSNSVNDYFEDENGNLPDNEFRRTILLKHTATQNDSSQALVP